MQHLISMLLMAPANPQQGGSQWFSLVMMGGIILVSSSKKSKRAKNFYRQFTER